MKRQGQKSEVVALGELVETLQAKAEADRSEIEALKAQLSAAREEGETREMSLKWFKNRVEQLEHNALRVPPAPVPDALYRSLEKMVDGRIEDILRPMLNRACESLADTSGIAQPYGKLYLAAHEMAKMKMEALVDAIWEGSRRAHHGHECEGR